jgi:hypothetical protein
MQPTVKNQILSWVVLVFGATLLGVAGIAFTPSSAPAAPTISWLPASLNESVSAGQTKTVPVSFVASENVKSVVVRVVPELQPFVRTNPSSFASITKGQTVNLSIIISSPATSLPGTFDGTIQLRNGNGKNQKPFERPLPVTLSIIWVTFQDSNTGIAFSYPDFGQPSQVEQNQIPDDEGGGRLFQVKLPSQFDGTPTRQFGIVFHPNTQNQTLFEWFSRNVDFTGALLTSGAFSLVNLPNGIQAIVNKGPVPPEHLEPHGPVALVYAMSNSGATVIVLNTSQENDLNFYGYPPDQQVILLQNLAANIIAP